VIADAAGLLGRLGSDAIPGALLVRAEASSIRTVVTILLDDDSSVRPEASSVRTGVMIFRADDS
jgi:hypothetical protein